MADKTIDTIKLNGTSYSIVDNYSSNTSSDWTLATDSLSNYITLTESSSTATISVTKDLLFDIFYLSSKVGDKNSAYKLYHESKIVYKDSYTFSVTYNEDVLLYYDIGEFASTDDTGTSTDDTGTIRVYITSISPNKVYIGGRGVKPSTSAITNISETATYYCAVYYRD